MLIKAVMPNVDMVFTYAVPPELEPLICVGQRISAPFGKGNKIIEGIIVEVVGDDALALRNENFAKNSIAVAPTFGIVPAALSTNIPNFRKHTHLFFIISSSFFIL